ncbi:MAG: MBL fold metallo-hydrolase [Actinomycetota bacterium]|nr:MBL fold metallo-hydrolase [Actinomycetota bacterium]
MTEAIDHRGEGPSATQPARPSSPSAKRELGRGERVLPGVFRLRLPLPWPGVPHCNAWAVRAGDGVVLFDTGMHQPDSLAQLERALEMCALRLEQVSLVVCTHAHSDHYGQAATIVERTGCELWMHPNHAHMKRMAEDPDAVFDRRMEVARQSGVPEEPLRRYTAERRSRESGIAGVIEPDRDLLEGVRIDTDLGPWITYETPGHAPSHVCLFQPERRTLICGDHLLGRISLFFDYGWTPDPVGEFLRSLDVADGLGARLCLPGHGRTFADVRAHINGNRTLVQERLAGVLEAVGAGPLSAFEIVPHVYGDSLSQHTAHWVLSKVLGYLTHLQALGRVRSIPGEPERWTA